MTKNYIIQTDYFGDNYFPIGYPYFPLSISVSINYTEIVRFTVELEKVVSESVMLCKTISENVELNKVVNLTAYAELEDNS